MVFLNDFCAKFYQTLAVVWVIIKVSMTDGLTDGRTNIYQYSPSNMSLVFEVRSLVGGYNILRKTTTDDKTQSIKD